MRRAEIACAIVLLIASGVVAREAIWLDIGWGESGPKGGFFPFWLAVLLAGSSATILFQHIGPWLKEIGKPFLSRKQFRSVLTVLLPIALAVALIEVVGFYPTAFLYLFSYTWWTGRQPWFTIITVSLLFPAGAFLIFERWFLIPLPKGYLGIYLPF
jgi:putative tricarboxylic transport membrane protein